MLKTVRDVMIILTCLWGIVLTMTAHLNPKMVAEWKYQVDEAYWNIYAENCTDTCIGD